MAKLKLASYWAAACGGCDTSILDVHEKILDIAAAADIVFWPIAVDTKYADVEAMPDKSIDVTLFHGAIRNSEGEHVAKLLRQKSKVLVAFGSCAAMGGLPGLANLFNRDQIFEAAYLKSPSTPNNTTLPHVVTKVPEGELTLPELFNTVKTLAQVVPVDYFMPGCAPTPKQIMAVVGAIVSGKLPPAGTWIGVGERTVCEECPREKTETKFKAFQRIATAQPDPKKCLMEQGFLCVGMATRGGCDARCQAGGVGCRGCYGPPDGVVDQGAKALSAIASMMDAKTDEEVAKIIDGLPDVLRSFNRYGIPSSLLARKSL